MFGDTQVQSGTCDGVYTWGGADAIRIEVNFTRKTTKVYTDGVLKGVYENLTIDEFVRLQCVCQMAYNAVLERFITKKKAKQ